MPQRTLGPLSVSSLGLGCMGMSELYGPGDEQQSVGTLHAALDAGRPSWTPPTCTARSPTRNSPAG